MTPDVEGETNANGTYEIDPKDERIGGETSFAARLEAAAQPSDKDVGAPKHAKSSSEAKAVDGAGAEGQPSVSYFPRERGAARDVEKRQDRLPQSWRPKTNTPSTEPQTMRRTPVPTWKHRARDEGRNGDARKRYADDLARRDATPTWKPKVDANQSFTFPSPATASPVRNERRKGAEALYSPYRRLRPTPSGHTPTPASPGYASWRQATMSRTVIASPHPNMATPIAVTTGKRRRIDDESDPVRRPPASRLRLGVSATHAQATPGQKETGSGIDHGTGPSATPGSKRVGFGDISTETARRILMTLDSLGKTATGTLAPETDAGKPTPVDFTKTFQKLSTPPTKPARRERPPPVDMLGTLGQQTAAPERTMPENQRFAEKGFVEDRAPSHGPGATEQGKPSFKGTDRVSPASRGDQPKPSEEEFPVFTFRSPVPEPELEHLAHAACTDGSPAPVFAFGTDGAPASTPAGTAQSIPGSPTDIARANAQAAAAAASPLPMADLEDEGEEEGEELPQKGFSAGLHVPPTPRLSTGLDFLKKTAEDAKAAADASAKHGAGVGPAAKEAEHGTAEEKAAEGKDSPTMFKWGTAAAEADLLKGPAVGTGTQNKEGSETPQKTASIFRFGQAPAQTPTVGFVFDKTTPSFPSTGEKGGCIEKKGDEGTQDDKETGGKEDTAVPKVSSGWDASFLNKNEKASQQAADAAKDEINKVPEAPSATSGSKPLFTWAPPKESAGAGSTPAPKFVFGQGQPGGDSTPKQENKEDAAKPLFGGFPSQKDSEKTADANDASKGFPAFKFGASAPSGFVFGSTPAAAKAGEEPDSKGTLEDGGTQPKNAQPASKPSFPAEKAPVNPIVDTSTPQTVEKNTSSSGFGAGNQSTAFKFGAQSGGPKSEMDREGDVPKVGTSYMFGKSSTSASMGGKGFIFGAAPSADEKASAPAESVPQPSSTLPDQVKTDATTKAGGFTFGSMAGQQVVGPSGTAPVFGTGQLPAANNAAAPVAFGTASSTPAFGGSNSAAAFGSGASTPAFGSAASTSAFGGSAAAPSFGIDNGISGGPVFGSSSAAPAFGSAASTSNFGGVSSTPVFGASGSASGLGASTAAGSFGSTQPAPAFGGVASASPFGNASTPVFGSGASGFGAAPSTPAFGSSAASGFGAGAGNAPAFGAPNSTPAFGNQGGASAFGGLSNTPVFGASGSAPGFGASGNTPAFGAASNAPGFGASGNAPSFGAPGGAPGFGAPGSAPAFGAAENASGFGGGPSFPSNNAGSLPDGGGGFSMGSAGQPQPGQRRRIVRARRPARK